MRSETVDGMEVLSTEECLALLRSHSFGRLALAVRGAPLILPVNYVFEEPSIVIRTAPGTKLEHAPLTTVAFEVDETSTDGRCGWSVVVQGPAFDITEAIDEYSTALRRLPVEVWAPGEKAHWLKIAARSVTGRCFGRTLDHKGACGEDD